MSFLLDVYLVAALEETHLVAVFVKAGIVRMNKLARLPFRTLAAHFEARQGDFAPLGVVGLAFIVPGRGTNHVAPGPSRELVAELALAIELAATIAPTS